MKSYDKTLTRLILILTKLSNNELPTPKELAEEFGVGIRTIQRDLYERLAYFPIEKDSSEKLRFIDGFSLDKSTLENDEMLLVYLSLSQLKEISKSFENKINNVISKLLTPTFNTPYHIKATSFQKLDSCNNLIKDIEFCIKNEFISQLKLNENLITIHPYKIVSFNGIWYLLANEIETNRVKSFLINDITNIIPSKEKYKIDKNIDEILSNVHSAWFEDGNSFEVKILVYKEIAYFFKLKKVISTQKILNENVDGSLIISFEVSHYEDIDNIIKSWLPHIEVLEPFDYKTKFKKEFEVYLNNI